MTKEVRNKGVLVSPKKNEEILNLIESLQKSTRILSDYCMVHDASEEIYYLSPLVNLLRDDSEKLGDILDNLFLFND